MAPAEAKGIPAGKTGAARGRSGKGSRRRSRELALQALYQWLVAGHEADDLCRQAGPDLQRADQAYFETLVRGVIERAAELDAGLQPFLDRPAKALSPVEHALLLIGTFELSVSLDVPYRVVINEAVELAKAYGGTDGHKYVNGVLDKLAAQLRPGEARKS
ncbi:MAG TPA: transcription antitermination factor NusB [Burkholderiales bacterium]|nr:transcription antitermination factor NusB [Burkholderiales bacterium]